MTYMTYDDMLGLFYKSFQNSLSKTTAKISSDELRKWGELTEKMTRMMLCHPDHVMGYLARSLPFVCHRFESRNMTGEQK